MNISPIENATMYSQQPEHVIQQKKNRLLAYQQPKRIQSLQVSTTPTTISSASSTSYQEELERLQRRLDRHRFSKQQVGAEDASAKNNPLSRSLSRNSSMRSLPSPQRSLDRSSSLRSLPPRSPTRVTSVVGQSPGTSSKDKNKDDKTLKKSSSCRQLGAFPSESSPPSQRPSSRRSSSSRPSLKRADASFNHRQRCRTQRLASTTPINTSIEQRQVYIKKDPSIKSFVFEEEEPPPPKRKMSAIERLVHGKEYEPKESRTLEKAFRKELEANLNHETWIQKVKINRDGSNPFYFWQSLETGKKLLEPPFGSYRTVDLDDVLLYRKSKTDEPPVNALTGKKSKKSKSIKIKTSSKKKSKNKIGLVDNNSKASKPHHQQSKTFFSFLSSNKSSRNMSEF